MRLIGRQDGSVELGGGHSRFAAHAADLDRRFSNRHIVYNPVNDLPKRRQAR